MKTRHPLVTGIIFAKNVTHQHGFETTTSRPPGRRTTNCAMVTNISTLVFTKWSIKVDIWQSLETNARQIMIFLSLNVSGK